MIVCLFGLSEFLVSLECMFSGKSEDNYIMHLAQDGILSGYRPVVFVQRGIGGLYLKVNTHVTRLHSFKEFTCCVYYLLLHHCTVWSHSMIDLFICRL